MAIYKRIFADCMLATIFFFWPQKEERENDCRENISAFFSIQVHCSNNSWFLENKRGPQGDKMAKTHQVLIYIRLGIVFAEHALGN